MKLSWKHIIGGIALLLALILALVPTREATISLDALAQNIETGRILIEPADLAAWLIEGRNDFVVVDVRAPEEFEKGHISTALNIPSRDIVAQKKIEQLINPDKMILVCGQGEADAAQTVLILKSTGYDAYVIRAGYTGWVSSVLNPKQPEQFKSQEQILQWKKTEVMAAHLRGDKVVEAPAPQVKPLIPTFKAVKKQKSGDQGC
ncbi:rhodanese-like domain-containing protein [candidate division CSSED10-310 bacterium]|uniref:Rhodanese-like domain-containing protein n=1 Tax=candidate division CSSED10-310 bacterium TaxID=2855610 RepID=A0ABV6Z413_UNCC1